MTPPKYLHFAALVWETCNRDPKTVEEWVALCEAEKLYDDLLFAHWLNAQKALSEAA